MSAMDVGRVCIKTVGREAGKKAIIVKLVGKNFALIDGKNVKRRKCSLNHLFPIEEKLGIKENEGHDSIIKLLK